MNDKELIEKIKAYKIHRAPTDQALSQLTDIWNDVYPDDYLGYCLTQDEVIDAVHRYSYTRHLVSNMLHELTVKHNPAGASSYALSLLLSECRNILNPTECIRTLTSRAPRSARKLVEAMYTSYIAGPHAGDMVSYRLRTVRDAAYERYTEKE